MKDSKPLVQPTQSETDAVSSAARRQHALVGLVTIATEIVACYAEVDTDSEPGWLVDLREALIPARAAIAEVATSALSKAVNQSPTGSSQRP